MSGITECVVLWDWLLSLSARFIYLAYISTSFLFIAKCNIRVCVCVCVCVCACVRVCVLDQAAGRTSWLSRERGWSGVRLPGRWGAPPLIGT